MIDWQKAEERPEKKQAVEGKILLDLRTMIGGLKVDLREANHNIVTRDNEIL